MKIEEKIIERERLAAAVDQLHGEKKANRFHKRLF